MSDKLVKIVADVPALRGVSRSLGNNVLFIVSSTGDQYLLDRTSSAADDGRLVVKPSWAGSGAGRFLILDSGSAVEDEGQRAVNGLRMASAGTHLQTLTVGADVYELTTLDSLAVGTPGHIAVDVHAGTTIKAQGKYTVAGGDAADTETLIINGKTYTLQSTLTNVDGHVKIGATPEDTIDNMVAAINLGAGAGTKYATLMTAHATVVGSKSSTDKLVLTAKIGGTPGNAYTLAGTASHWTRDAATMGTLTLGVDPSAENVIDALVLANASKTEAISFTKVSASELLLTADAVGVVTTACSETLMGSNNALSAVAMYGGKARASKKFAFIARVPNAQEVTLGNMHFKLNFTPSVVLPRVKVTASGVAKAWDGGYTISTTHVTLDNSGSTDWAATDTVIVEFYE